MPEVIFTGPDGRLEGRYHPAKKNAPIAIVLHPHPQFGGTMNNQIVYQLYYVFQERGFTCCASISAASAAARATFDHGVGELADAAAALDWAQTHQPGCARLLDRRLLVRRLDRHAAPDAPAGGRGLHLDRAARQPLRLLVPGALPVLRPDHQRRQGQGGAAEGRQRPGRQAEDAEGHRHRPEGACRAPTTSSTARSSR